MTPSKQHHPLTSTLSPGICDNGACITSVRGSTGVVDCYDPDNPSGTTQSCIDFVPTTTCFSTDRCYTCESDQPFCFWQTYIDTTPAPTLSWFSCVETDMADVTYYASTITNHLLPTQSSGVSGTGGLSKGAIAGISSGGAVFLIAVIASIIWIVSCVRTKRRRRGELLEEERRGNEIPQTSEVAGSSIHELPQHARESIYFDQHTGQWKRREVPTEPMGIPLAELPDMVQRAGASSLGIMEGSEGGWPLRSVTAIK